jgi:hypothetical protein
MKQILELMVTNLKVNIFNIFKETDDSIGNLARETELK